MPETKPAADEHAPHQRRYIDAVEGPILDTLRAQRAEVQRVLLAIRDEDAGYRYAEKKWTIREVIGHLSDAERVYGYRALVIAHGDTMLPKYDPDAYVAASNYDARSVRSLVEELLAVRESTLQLFANLAAEAWSRRATLGTNPLSVRALAWIAAGHVRQHLDVLHERYGVAR
jgi:hypothetical protein